MKKFISLIIIIILLFSSTTIFADDIDEEADNDFLTIWNEIKEISANIRKTPQINSRVAIVLDKESKQVLYEKNMDQKRAMASTTKIMTALIVLENEDLNQKVEIGKKAANTGGSRLGLKARR